MPAHRIRHQYIYTIITIGVLAVLYEIAVRTLRAITQHQPFFEPVIYGATGVVLLVAFAPLRTIIRQYTRRLILRVSIPADHIEEKLVNIFAQYTDKNELVQHVRALLMSSMGFSDVVVYLRSEAKQFESVLDNETSHGKALRSFLLKDQDAWHVLTRVELMHRPELHDYVLKKNIHTVVPLAVNATLVGWIECRGGRMRLVKDTVDTLEHVRTLLSVTFHRVMLDVKFAIRIEQLVALNRISQTMNSSLNVKETLESVMDSIIQLLHVDRALMYLMNPDGKTFAPRIGRGMSEHIRLDFTVDISKSIFSHVVKYRQPMVVLDAEHDPRVNKMYAGFVQTKSFVIVPMVSKEKVIGVIGVDNLHSGKAVSEINLELLVTLANDAAIALTNSRLYEEVHNFNTILQERIDEATKHLRALLEMKSHFLSVASHQLRTPTTVIKGMLSMVEEDPKLSEEKLREFVHHAYVSSGRLERIVNELLSATELEDPQIRVNLEKIDIVDLIRGIIAHLEPLATQRKNTLTLNTEVEELMTMTDKYKLFEALSNLVDNAIRYTKNGTITVSLVARAEHYTISVTDTGMGVTREEREKIFDKFQRGQEGIEMDPNGTGLGLYIVKRTLEVLHGSIDVQSAGRGKGATFSVTLPK
ncbi:MAG: GAF domain-containing sensor histidine kinase [Candidatus Kerfeldbacteria bacterium]|nr:GAF domain-containing sensor histidine kinase [Candidatus Kerfeldbacteria bacterium]